MDPIIMLFSMLLTFINFEDLMGKGNLIFFYLLHGHIVGKL